jgi:hypothetical protein
MKQSPVFIIILAALIAGVCIAGCTTSTTPGNTSPTSEQTHMPSGVSGINSDDTAGTPVPLKTAEPLSSPPLSTISSATDSAQSSWINLSHFSGSASGSQGFSVTKGSGFRVTGFFSGKGALTVRINDAGGKVVAEVFNKTGPYADKKIIHLEPGQYSLEVAFTGGSWKIDVSPT